MTATRKGLRGWPIVGLVAVLSAGGSGLILLAQGTGAEATGLILRFTARLSFACFLLAFLAAPLSAFFRSSPGIRWTRSNRRYLGVAFAASHTVHALAILRMASLQPDAFTLTESIPGLIAYAFLAAMTATSFDATARMLGPRPWKALHRTGMYYLGFIFFMTFLGRLPAQPLYVLFNVAILGAWALRVGAYIRNRQRRRSPAGAAAA